MRSSPQAFDASTNNGDRAENRLGLAHSARDSESREAGYRRRHIWLQASIECRRLHRLRQCDAVPFESSNAQGQAASTLLYSTTPLIEVAEDSEKAKGFWIMPGLESGLSDPSNVGIMREHYSAFLVLADW